MSFEDDLRETLESVGRSTETPPGDLRTVMKRGRRRRVASYAGSGAAVVLVVGALTFGIQNLGGGADPITAADQAGTSTTVAAGAINQAPSEEFRDDGAEASTTTTAASATTVTTVTDADGAPLARFSWSAFASPIEAAGYYSEGNARRVFLPDQLAVVDLADGAVFDLSDGPFGVAAYGIVEPDGDLLIQAIEPEACCPLWRRDAVSGSWTQVLAIPGEASLLAGYHGRNDGTIDLYFEVAVEGEFDDASTAAVRYDSVRGGFSELWRTDVPGDRYSTDPDGTLLLVEDRGVDPAFGPAYSLLQAATGDLIPGASPPGATFSDDDETVPTATADFASLLTQGDVVYFETPWERAAGPVGGGWVVDSITGDRRDQSILSSYRFDESAPPDQAALFACVFGGRSIDGGDLVDLRTGERFSLFPDVGVVRPSC